MVEDRNLAFVDTGNSPGKAHQILPSSDNYVLELYRNPSIDELGLSLLQNGNSSVAVKQEKEKENLSDSDNYTFTSIPVKVEVIEELEGNCLEMSVPPPRPPQRPQPPGVSGGSKTHSRLLSNLNNRVKNEVSSSDKRTTLSPSKLPVTVTELSTGVEYKMARKASDSSGDKNKSSGKDQGKEHRIKSNANDQGKEHRNKSSANDLGKDHRNKSCANDQGKEHRNKSSDEKSGQGSVIKVNNPQKPGSNKDPKPCSSKSLKESQRPNASSSPDISDMPFLLPSLADLLVDVPLESNPAAVIPSTVEKKKYRDKFQQSSNQNTPRKIQVLEGIPPMPNVDSDKKPQRVNARRRSYGLTSEQVSTLREVFEVQPYPKLLEILDLETATGLKRKQITRWFSIERNKGVHTTYIAPVHQPSRSDYGAQDNRHHTNQNNLKAAPKADFNVNSQSGGTRNPETFTNQKDEYRVPHFQDYTIPKKRKAHPSTGSHPSSAPPTKTSKLHLLEQREMRMRMAASINSEMLRQCLYKSQRRIETLFLLFTKKKYDMKKTLLKETVRLRDNTMKVSPFSKDQVKEMDQWRKNFFKIISAEVSEEKKEKLQCVQTSIIDVWHPIIVYGKLTGVSLEIAIEDFLVRSSRGIADGSDATYTVPQFLRYIESHDLG